MKQIIAMALVVLSLASFSQTGEKNFIDQNYIEVSGKAEMEIIPNEIYLKIVISEKDLKNKQELADVERIMIEKLSEIGIDVSRQLVIRDMASSFQKYWLKSTEINSVKEYQLKVENAKTAGQVIRELEAVGLSTISIDKIDHSEIEKYRAEVKVKAIKAAKDKAISLTKAIDQSIGKAIYIQEIDNQLYNTFQGQVPGLSNIVVAGYGSSGKYKMEEPDIEFEKIKLNSTVMTRFELK